MSLHCVQGMPAGSGMWLWIPSLGPCPHEACGVAETTGGKQAWKRYKLTKGALPFL